METQDKIIVASNKEIDSIKVLIKAIETKAEKTDKDLQILETAKFKLRALDNNEIIMK